MSQSAAQLQRKVKKPMIEKKRRERINKCLRQLQKLVVDGTDADSSRLSAKMEKAEILEMTVAYVSQLHGTRCGLLSSDVSAAAASKSWNSQKDVCDDDGQFFSSSSSSEEDYRAGYSECLLHVQRFLADQTAVLGCDVALPQLLMNHLSRFIVDAAGSPTERDSGLDTADPQPQLSVVCDGSCRSSSLRQDDQLMADHPHPRRSAVSPLLFIVPPCTVIQPSTDTAASFLLYSPSISTSVSADCPSAAATCSPPDNADHDVWRPWRPTTTTYSDVSDTSSAS